MLVEVTNTIVFVYFPSILYVTIGNFGVSGLFRYKSVSYVGEKSIVVKPSDYPTTNESLIINGQLIFECNRKFDYFRETFRK